MIDNLSGRYLRNAPARSGPTALLLGRGGGASARTLLAAPRLPTTNPPEPPKPSVSRRGSTFATGPRVARMPAPSCCRWRRVGCGDGCAAGLLCSFWGCAFRFGVAPGKLPLPLPLRPGPAPPAGAEEALLRAGGTHAIARRRERQPRGARDGVLSKAAASGANHTNSSSLPSPRLSRGLRDSHETKPPDQAPLANSEVQEGRSGA